MLSETDKSPMLHEVPDKMIKGQNAVNMSVKTVHQTFLCHALYEFVYILWRRHGTFFTFLLVFFPQNYDSIIRFLIFFRYYVNRRRTVFRLSLTLHQQPPKCVYWARPIIKTLPIATSTVDSKFIVQPTVNHRKYPQKGENTDSSQNPSKPTHCIFAPVSASHTQRALVASRRLL